MSLFKASLICLFFSLFGLTPIDAFPDDSQKGHLAISAALSSTLMVSCTALTSEKFFCTSAAIVLVNLAGLIKETGIVSEDVRVDRQDLLANGLGSLVVIPISFAF